MKLSRNPQKLGPHDWYYEEPKGIEIIHEEADHHFIHIRIPWWRLKRSLARYE